MLLFVENIRSLVRCHRYRLRSDRQQIETIMRMNIRGGTAIDIGANKGAYCYWLSKAVGRSGSVIAFEPQPELIRIIEAQHRAFGNSHLLVKSAALSDFDGKMTMRRNGVGDKSASLSKDKMSGSIIVETCKLDSIHPGSASNIKFIKCDVEGNEYKTLLGAERIIKSHQPIIQVEVSIGEETHPLKSFFERLGYRCAMYDKMGFSKPIWRWRQRLTLDFLAFKPKHLNKEIDARTTLELKLLRG